ncbi:MAG TPA: chemotaxis protein CheW [Anaeromyxobacteraceae bacterium]|jgi:purine-binding chemotaxis protein CheW|nr:chemotaxis protein CheW [Anaeromyxobacteraceae bacterium]
MTARDATGPQRPLTERREAAAVSDPIVQLCAFRVGDEEYVVDLMRIREIVQPLPITAVPHAPEYVEGVVNLRGEVIPVLDARKRFGLAPGPYTRRTKFLIVHLAGRVLALVVDGVSEVLRIPRSAIRPAPELMGGGARRFFLGVCGTGGGERAGARPAAPAAQAARPSAGPGIPARGALQKSAAPARMRLLLNVKALLEPAAPAALAAARALAGAARNG